MRRISGILLFTFLTFQLVSSGWLGIMIQDLSPKLAIRYGIPRSKGVVVTRVEFGSPAMEAGIQEGDLIISLNTKEISDSETLVKVVTKLSPGDEVPLTIIRQRKTKHLEILVGSSHRFAA